MTREEVLEKNIDLLEREKDVYLLTISRIKADISEPDKILCHISQMPFELRRATSEWSKKNW